MSIEHYEIIICGTDRWYSIGYHTALELTNNYFRKEKNKDLLLLDYNI